MGMTTRLGGVSILTFGTACTLDGVVAAWKNRVILSCLPEEGVVVVVEELTESDLGFFPLKPKKNQEHWQIAGELCVVGSMCLLPQNTGKACGLGSCGLG